MLEINKKDILKYAQKNKIKFYDDPTNEDCRFFRNKVRLELDSHMNDLNFRNSILKVSKINKKKFLELSCDIKNKKLKILIYSNRNEIVILDKIKLLKENLDFFILMIKNILNKEFSYIHKGSTLSWKNFFSFVSSNQTGKNYYLKKNANIDICHSKDYIYIYKNNKRFKKIKFNALGNYKNNLGLISLMRSNKFIKSKDKNYFCIPYNYIDHLILDNWNYGDKCITNSGSTVKVSDIFINNKLSLFEKKNYPIIKYKNDIVWIPNLFHGKVDIGAHKNFINLKWNSLL